MRGCPQSHQRCRARWWSLPHALPARWRVMTARVLMAVSAAGAAIECCRLGHLLVCAWMCLCVCVRALPQNAYFTKKSLQVYGQP